MVERRASPVRSRVREHLPRELASERSSRGGASLNELFGQHRAARDFERPSSTRTSPKRGVHELEALTVEQELEREPRAVATFPREGEPAQGERAPRFESVNEARGSDRGAPDARRSACIISFNAPAASCWPLF